MDAAGALLIHQWGAGLEGVELAAARSRNIYVANVPASGGNAQSVAEHAIFLLLSLLRQAPLAASSVRSGLLGTPLGRMLAGNTVCLYGLGNVALALARRLRPFGVRILGITRDPRAEKVAVFGLDGCYATARSADGALAPEQRPDTVHAAVGLRHGEWSMLTRWRRCRGAATWSTSRGAAWSITRRSTPR